MGVKLNKNRLYQIILINNNETQWNKYKIKILHRNIKLRKYSTFRKNKRLIKKYPNLFQRLDILSRKKRKKIFLCNTIR